jgi:hypothetical protein
MEYFLKLIIVIQSFKVSQPLIPIIMVSSSAQGPIILIQIQIFGMAFKVLITLMFISRLNFMKIFNFLK